MNRRHFMAMLGSLAVVTPQPDALARLPELSLDAFADDDRAVWINGQPLRGVKELEHDDEWFPLFGGVGRWVYFQAKGPFRSAVRLRGFSTEQTYRDFYAIVDALCYEPLDVMLVGGAFHEDGKAFLRRQQMRFHDIHSVHDRWERQRSVFGYPSYRTMADLPRLTDDVAAQAWGLCLELTSQEPYDQWTWLTYDSSHLEYKRHHPRHQSAQKG